MRHDGTANIKAVKENSMFLTGTPFLNSESPNARDTASSPITLKNKTEDRIQRSHREYLLKL